MRFVQLLAKSLFDICFAAGKQITMIHLLISFVTIILYDFVSDLDMKLLIVLKLHAWHLQVCQRLSGCP